MLQNKVVDNPADGNCLHWSILYWILRLGYIPSLNDMAISKDGTRRALATMRGMMADWVKGHKARVADVIFPVDDAYIGQLRTAHWNTHVGDELPKFYALWLLDEFNVVLQCTADPKQEGYPILRIIKDDCPIQGSLIMGSRRQRPQQVLRLVRRGDHYNVFMDQPFDFDDLFGLYRISS